MNQVWKHTKHLYLERKMLFRQVVLVIKRRILTCLNRLLFCVKHGILLLVGLCIGLSLYRFGILYDQVRIEVQFNITKGNFSEPNGPVGNISGNEYIVPNIVHFIWFGDDMEMRYIQYVSIFSAHKIQRPDLIMFHCNDLPVGEWWERLWHEVPLKIVYLDPPRAIHDQSLVHTYHKGDVAKLQILQKYGGIYLDYDVIVIQSLDPLRQYAMTMGREKTEKLNAGIIVAHKDALFLKLWYASYRQNYKPYDWDYNCAKITFQIYKKQPELVHVEPFRLTTPDWRERHLLWNDIINWRELYVVHVMLHLNWTSFTPESVKTMNNTFGEVVRQVYYNSPKLLID